MQAVPMQELQANIKRQIQMKRGGKRWNPLSK